MDREITLDSIMKRLKPLAQNEAAERLAASGGLNRKITAVVRDSRKVKKDSLFVAIEGFKADGHEYLGMAKEKGALAAVTTRFVPDVELAQFKVENSREALALASAAFYGDPSRDLSVTGITGSNGKTSCSLMLREIFLAAGEDPGLIGTVLYSSKKSQKSAALTTPDATELQALFAEMRDAGNHYVIMEVSSIGRAQYRDAGTHYKVVAFNNISREHIDYHGSFEAYFAAKKSLIMSADPDSHVILNADDPHVISLASECPGKLITFGHKKDADVRAENLDMTSGFPSFDIKISKRIRPGLLPHERKLHLALNVPGYHSMMNALAAVAMALAHHLDAEAIVKGLTQFHGVERRFQNVFSGKFRVFDDHFANPGNIKLTLETLNAMPFKHLRLVYALRGNRGVTVCRESLEELFRYKELLKKSSIYATCSTEVVSERNKVQDDERACFREMMEKEGLSYTKDERLEDAVCRALDEVEHGDVILLAGCQGMDAGARLLLEELSRRHPAWSKEELMAPLRDRVCGQPGELA